MTYSIINFVDNSTPAINANNLNKMDAELKRVSDESTINKANIATNTANIASLSAGEVQKGAFTPSVGAEYPASGTNFSYYISNVTGNGYTFTTGALSGQVGQNMDKMLYTASGWSLIKNNVLTSIPNGAIGNINNPLLDLPLKNSLTLKQGVGSVTFARASTATYIDRYGVLKSAAINEARFEKEGLLIEGASTNSILYSEDFSVGTWTKAGLTVTPNAVVALDGNTTADNLLETATTGAHTVYQSITPVNGTQSVFAKSINGRKLQIKGGVSANDYVNFDVEIGAIGNIGSGVTGATIKDMGNGWFRCSATFLTSGSIAYNSVQSLTSAWNESFLGDVTKGLTLWGAQEEALPFATSYIPTTTATVTRSADVPSVPFPNNCPSYNNSVTVLADVSRLGNMGSTIQEIFRSNSSSIIGRFNNLDMFFYVGGQIISGVGQGYTQSVKRMAFVLNKDDTALKMYKSGIQIASATYTGNITTADTLIYLGSLGGSGQFLYGHISNFRIYDTALTDEEITIA